jgi:hypothetical protein
MNIIKRAATRVLIRLLDAMHRPNYVSGKTDEQVVSQWLHANYKHNGWTAYFAREDYRLLKMLGQYYDREEHLILIGRRAMLLTIMQDMYNEHESRVKEQKREVVKEANRPSAPY